jgi:small conductance mechanosensitive channel
MKLWQQIPTTEELEDFVGVDDLTAFEFFGSIAVIIIAFLLSRIVRRIVRWTLNRFPQITEPIAALGGRAAGWIVILIGVVYSLVILGIDMVPALMVLIVVAIVTFFAGRGLMENFSTGLVLQGAPMFGPGDEIVTEAGTGRVVEITGRTVLIDTPDGETLHVPNRLVIQEAVTNLTARGIRRSSITVGVAYGTDLGEAKQAIVDAAERCSTTLRQPTPEALFTEFGDSSINLQLLFWHEPLILDRQRAIDNVGRSIVNVFAERGIVIAFPQRRLWWGEAGSDRSDTPEG